MNDALEQLVRQRAGNVCEYCGLPQRLSRLRLPIDHVVARQHGGETVEDNLALACVFCNRHKGPNISGIDPVAKKMTRLFHPRRDSWNHHFQWNRSALIGLTEVGRATINGFGDQRCGANCHSR
jgi:5-methylcytosine-specific restriction endonuclease McrA